jgi:signal transduction histidine kinase
MIDPAKLPSTAERDSQSLISPLPRQSALTYLAITALAVGFLLSLTNAFEREELQLINKRFEWRYLLMWNPISLSRLGPQQLVNYHQEHELPPAWYAWDYTLSWLLENNHSQPKVDVAIFNRLPEDEPPMEAVADHPWMRPLTRTPMPRATVAGMVNVLAKAGAKAIILDNDFPQYTDDDAILAKAIHEARIPVFMVRSVYRQSSGHYSFAQTTTMPSGVLEELQKLEPDANVVGKYTGTSCLYTDHDQTVRRMLLRIPSVEGGDSVVLKALQATNTIKSAATIPDVIDVNFITPPNADVFKIRPLTYLIDPDRVKDLLHPPADSDDIHVRGAIAIVGDGVTDVFDTPYTSAGLNLTSGSEVLAHSINTIAARNWLYRCDLLQSILFVVGAVGLAATAFSTSRKIQQKKGAVAGWKRLAADGALVIGLIVLWNVFAAVVFTVAGLIVPIIVPEICIAAGFVAAFVIEREQQRSEAVRRKMEAAQVRHESELAVQAAEGQLRQIMGDRQRRREFVRRINHDLRAPLTVLNWNLSKLCSDGLNAKGAQDKIERLVKTSDRLYELIAQLTNTYDETKEIERQEVMTTTCQLAPLLSACVSVCQCLAEMNGGTVTLKPVDPDATAIFEPMQLSRVVENLIKNAFVHNPHGTAITVSVDSNEQNHIVKVSDNGKGIAPEHVGKIFDAEYRVNPGDGKGTGLGLSIVKSLVEETGGNVTVVSQVGIGTTFLIALRSADQLEIPAESDESTRDASSAGLVPLHSRR